MVTPQVCEPPGLTPLNANPPATGNGLPCRSVVPSPSWPYLFQPQQYAVLLVVTPQVCEPPALKVLNASPPDTATGSSCVVLLPIPI